MEYAPHLITSRRGDFSVQTVELGIERGKMRWDAVESRVGPGVKICLQG